MSEQVQGAENNEKGKVPLANEKGNMGECFTKKQKVATNDDNVIFINQFNLFDAIRLKQ